jgi:outer membrane protein assembly factor BamB
VRNTERRWSYSTGKIITSSAAVANGVVYLNTEDDTVYALQADTGKVLWSHVNLTGTAAPPASGLDPDSLPVYSSPAVADGTVYVGSRDSIVYALWARDGSMRWSFLTKAGILSSPSIVDGVVYIGSGDGYIYAIWANSGRLRWKYQTRAAVLGSPTIVNGVVYIGSQDTYLYAIWASSGRLQWKYRTEGHVISLPTVSV